MSVIYIDYPKLHKSTKKRILFLQAIIDLISTDRDFIKYYTLGLVDEDKVCFAELLNREFIVLLLIFCTNELIYPVVCISMFSVVE